MVNGALCYKHDTSGSPYVPLLRKLIAPDWRETTSRIERDRVAGLAEATKATYDRYWRLWREYWETGIPK
jgi:hypothetical protein